MPSRSTQQPKPPAGEPSKPKPQLQRLQRLLASAGFGSRRQCEELIETGRVDVDGKTVTKLGTTVDPAVHKVRVDGVPLKKQKLVYYAVNKPIGVVTTNSDPHGRPRVVDLVPKSERVFAVGRLDRSSEGLILLTNDGDLAQKLTHPKFGVRKVYRVTVAGRVDPQTMKQMRQGIYIAEGRVQVEGARIFKTRSKATEMEIVLREGKNREIRRILARLGHKVLQLRRIAVGPLRLGDMPPGAYRIVSREEVKKLQRASEQSADDDGKPMSRRGGPKRAGRKKSAGRRPSHTTPHQRPPAKGKAKIAGDFAVSSKAGAVIGADPSEGDDGPERKRTKKGTRRSGKKLARAAGGKRKAGKRTSTTQRTSVKRKSAKKGSTAAGKSQTRRGKPAAQKRAARKRGNQNRGKGN